MGISDRTTLVGDVGGTHARFAIAEASDTGTYRLHDRLDLAIQFASFIEALDEYFARLGIQERPPAAAIAVAGPVTAGQVTFTNRNWRICERELQDFGFQRALLVNDFAALALAAEHLSDADLVNLGPPILGAAGETISIIGAGTGFGVACLARSGNRAVPMATEGGHIGFAPRSEEEIELLRVLTAQFGRVSVERILSGPGLESLYHALARMSGRPAPPRSAPQITEDAAGGDAACQAALGMFCSIYGAVAGDIALAHGARGGLYIAGGIALKIQPFLIQSGFRASFESKGRLSEFVKAIPTRLIRSPDAALLGAARAAAEPGR